MLPWLSRLSVRKGPAIRFRHRRSCRYQRISPLHRQFRLPLLPRAAVVSRAVLQLSWRISPVIRSAAYAPFKTVIPNNVWTVRLTAAAGTNLARPCFSDRSSFTLSFGPKRFTTRRPSSRTRRRSVKLALIAEDSRLQPPVGVWPVSQCQWRGSCSHTR